MVHAIPQSLTAKFNVMRSLLTDSAHPLQEAACHLLVVSEYAQRHIPILQQLLDEDDCLVARTKQDYQVLLPKHALESSIELHQKALRQYRNREFLRLLLRGVAQLDTIEATMHQWSDCADVVILYAMTVCIQAQRVRYGTPYDEDGGEAALYVLAMGKLGGQELNFSSDIDLIFTYSAVGNTSGQESLTNQVFYTKVVQQFVQLLQQITADGFVFRVDLRLRPNGDSGPLVCSLAFLETYYQEQGRDWERYAMVKARLIDVPNHTFIRQVLTPFVYRRYVDFSVIDSLRGMKALIEREIQLNPMLNDIKRGRGGIREIEFIIQSFQLIRGGRLPQIQTQSAMAALHVLNTEGLLHHATVLRQAYLFLRRVENALQSSHDQQTHVLPVNTLEQAQIAYGLGFSDWSIFLGKLNQYRRIVRRMFQSILRDHPGEADEQRLCRQQWSLLWQGQIEPTQGAQVLTSFGFANGTQAYQMLQAFRHSPRCSRLSQAARMRLERLMSLLFLKLRKLPNADAVLLQSIRFLENIVGRSAYLALLTENPTVLDELLYWFAHSPFISELLLTQPFLLEVLIDQTQDWYPPERAALQQQLQEKMNECNDEETIHDALRQFKLSCFLLAARAELYATCSPLMIAEFLSLVAELILLEVFHQAHQQLTLRYPDMQSIASKFAIVAYGKLGSGEMNYSSDLDLVFLHQAAPHEEYLVTRLTQRILLYLTLRTQAGILYAVDTQLRPSGEAGLLVSPMDAFVDYQMNQAWIWEHQALIRARIFIGNPVLFRQFQQLKHSILSKAREMKTLVHEVQSMRKKMDAQSSHRALIKYQSGGLLDIEFLVQCLVLVSKQPIMAEITNTEALLSQLAHNQQITAVEYQALTNAYKACHQQLHQEVLQPGKMQISYDANLIVAIKNEIYQRL